MFAVLLLAIVPMEDVFVDTVDVIEINRVHRREDGHECLSQVIFWVWVPEDRDWRTLDWRLLKTHAQIPCDETAVWIDNDGLLRKVRTKSLRWTRTWNDPEINDRSILSECRRRKLSQPVRREAK